MHVGTTWFLRSGLRMIAMVAILVCNRVRAKYATGPKQPAPGCMGSGLRSAAHRNALRSLFRNPNKKPAAEGQQAPITADPSADDPGRFVFKKQVQEVVLHATVVDEAGRLVTSLDRSAFSILCEQRPRTDHIVPARGRSGRDWDRHRQLRVHAGQAREGEPGRAQSDPRQQSRRTKFLSSTSARHPIWTRTSPLTSICCRQPCIKSQAGEVRLCTTRWSLLRFICETIRASPRKCFW